MSIELIWCRTYREWIHIHSVNLALYIVIGKLDQYYPFYVRWKDAVERRIGERQSKQDEYNTIDEKTRSPLVAWHLQ